MRFRRLVAHVFGVLRERRFELPRESVLLFGSNESGKSTFRSALETILYGFEPADRETHPLAAWDGGAGGDLRLEAELEREHAALLRVERVLASRGQLRTAEAGAAFESRHQGNNALDGVQGIPRELFRSLYSLELSQLAALDDKKVQPLVDDLLLPQMALRGLRPIGEVRRELSKDHDALWRPSQRGNPEAAKLNAELESLGHEAAEMARQERELRYACVEQARRETQCEELELESKRLDLEKEDVPFLRDLFELARRHRALGPPVDLATLGGVTLRDPAELAKEIDNLTNELLAPEARLARVEVALTPAESALLAAASDIGVAAHAAAELGADVKQASERRSHAAAQRDEARQQLVKVLARAPSEEELEHVRAIPLSALSAACAQWAAETARYAHTAPPYLPPWARLGVALALGVALLALFFEPRLGTIARPLAIAAALAGAVTALATWLARALRKPPASSSLLSDLLIFVPPAPALLAMPAELSRYVDAIAQAQTTLARAAGEHAKADLLEADVRTREARLAALCARLGLQTAGGFEEHAARLARALEQAQAREKQVADDRRERAVASERVNAQRPRLVRAKEQLAAIERALATAEPDAPTPALRFARVKQRIEEAEFLRRRESELRRDPRFSVFERDPRIAPDRDPKAVEWSGEATAERERERTRCGEALAAVHKRLGEISNLLGSDRGHRQAKVADRISEVKARLDAVHRERDALALLDAILARAERSFRDAHQPPVLQRAGEYLERMTHGRWRRLDFEEGAEGGLFVVGDARTEPARVAPPLSRGTLDQIFLCLRLGLLDHLDEGRERLPLVLDDALLRMDARRRAPVYELLGEISLRRQVILLTCQEWIAAEAERAWRLERIALPG